MSLRIHMYHEHVKLKHKSPTAGYDWLDNKSKSLNTIHSKYDIVWCSIHPCSSSISTSHRSAPDNIKYQNQKTISNLDAHNITGGCTYRFGMHSQQFVRLASFTYRACSASDVDRFELPKLWLQKCGPASTYLWNDAFSTALANRSHRANPTLRKRYCWFCAEVRPH